MLAILGILIISSFGTYTSYAVFELKSKVDKDVDKLIKEDPKKEVPVIIQVKASGKSKVLESINSKDGKLKHSSDEELVTASIKGDDVKGIASLSDVVKVWPDRETFVVLDESVGQIHAPFLWDLGFNGSGIKVAVLDTGVNKNHEMLSGRVIAEQDFTGSGNPNDGHGHGTHVAGIIAGAGKYQGVAPDVSILNGKVLDDNGQGQLSWLINGIDWAIEQGADVISLSLGATYSGDPEDLLSAPEVLKVKEAVSRGVVVVIASGNCGSGCSGFYGVTTPGITREAITVGAVDDSNNHAGFSSGDFISDYIKPDVSAPGVGICSSYLNDYSCLSGTSMSTPHVSGAVALLLQKDGSLTPAGVKALLEGGALDLGDVGKDTSYGSGVVDLSNLDGTADVPDDDYELVISAFELGEKDTIVLKYRNNLDGKKKFNVVFELEELDRDLSDESSSKINPGDVKEFKYKVKLNLIGKHLLKIKVYADDELVKDIERVVDVGSGAVFEDRLAGVSLG